MDDDHAREGTMAVGTEQGRTPRRRRTITVVLAVGVLTWVVSGALSIGGVASDDEKGPLSIALQVVGVVSSPLVLVALALGLTWWARRAANRVVASGAHETVLLAGRALTIVRTGMVVLFVVAGVLYVAKGLALWDEANSLQYTTGQYDETVNYYGLTVHERSLMTGSSAEVPGWYPVFVVARHAVLVVVAVGVAALILSRRPRHWMAYLATAFILLAPATGHLIHNGARLGGTSLAWLEIAVDLTAIVTLAAFLWLFPDGRFRGTFLRYLAGLVAGWLVIVVLATLMDGTRNTGEAAGLATWLFFLASFVCFGLGGIALQVWRYRHTRLADRRLARWNLALLVSIPLWFMPFDALHDLFGATDDADDGYFGFVWEQIHETLYLAVPVLIGLWVLFLVRRQGWWDFETLWNRTAVYAIAGVPLALVYIGVFLVVGALAAPLPETGEQVVAVVVATATVAFAYGPLIAGVRRWVDRRWFPERVETERLAGAFGDDIRRVPDPELVPERLVSTVGTTLGAPDVGLWLPAPAGREAGNER